MTISGRRLAALVALGSTAAVAPALVSSAEAEAADVRAGLGGLRHRRLLVRPPHRWRER